MRGLLLPGSTSLFYFKTRIPSWLCVLTRCNHNVPSLCQYNIKKNYIWFISSHFLLQATSVSIFWSLFLPCGTIRPWVHFSKDAPTDISDCYGRNQHLSDPEWPNSQCSTPSKLKIMRSMLLVSLLLWYLQAPTLWISFLAPFFWVLEKLMFILKFTSLQLHDKMQNHCGQKRTLTEHSKTADHPGKTAVHDKLVWIYLNHDF